MASLHRLSTSKCTLLSNIYHFRVFSFQLLIRRSLSSTKPPDSNSSDEFAKKKADSDKNKFDDDIKIDFDELKRLLDKSLKESTEGKETEVDKNFMNFRRLQEKAAYERSFIFSWKSVLTCITIFGITLSILFYMRKVRLDQREFNRKRMIGKANIGGDWELVDMDGRPASSSDLHGSWVLIYFGFTNCPDICPEEIEKMVDVVDQLERDVDAISIVPVFISVDPTRDTPERVRKYCSEFSPKLRGFTGSKEQIEKVTKAFRVYYSEGPKTDKAGDDYIVDHTVIMYLIDPDGQFHDYYGQNRRAAEIANVIRAKALKHEYKKNKFWF